MSIPTRLARSLNETLGADAADDLVTWLEELRAQHADLREQIRADFAEMRQVLREELRQELRQELLAVELRLTERIHAVDIKVDQRHAELMRWSFVFWVGAVAAIAALAGVLRG